MTSFSFSSAQATLPFSVLEELELDIRQWRDSGHSSFALAFSREFEAIRAGAEMDLRHLLGLTFEHKVLFLQGGATAQFSLAPMNLLGEGETADYIETGLWSRRASKEASALGAIHVAAKGDGRSLPDPQTWRVSPKAVYCHVTSNETVEGLQFRAFPDLGGIPLVADMTADFLTRPIPLSPFGLIYASAQKNLGIPGLTVVVIHESLMGRVRKGTPSPFNYALQAAERSKVNTPPTFAIAIAAKMLRWLSRDGGLDAAEARAIRKSGSLYAIIDQDTFYSSPAAKNDRSRISVRFHIEQPNLESAFETEARANGLLHLRGHASVGGLRASMYNSVPQEAADALAEFMDDFRRRKG